jgi:cytochrome P450
MEGQIAFNALLRRLPAPRLLEQKLEWRENAGLRGLTSLKMSLDPAPRN